MSYLAFGCVCLALGIVLGYLLAHWEMQ